MGRVKSAEETTARLFASDKSSESDRILKNVSLLLAAEIPFFVTYEGVLVKLFIPAESFDMMISVRREMRIRGLF